MPITVNTPEWEQLIQRIRISDPTLISLDLELNWIGGRGTRMLADALQHNTALALLNLNGNEIKDDGAMAMANALQYNTTLTSLNLGANGINDGGAVALADALQHHNMTLTSLNLGANGIEEKTTVRIQGYIERNAALRDQLHNAVKVDDLNTAQDLVTKGVSLLSTTGKEDNAGNIPLHWAVLNGHTLMVQWLVKEMCERHIPLTIRNAKEKNVLDLAKDQLALLTLLQPSQMHEWSSIANNDPLVPNSSKEKLPALQEQLKKQLQNELNKNLTRTLEAKQTNSRVQEDRNREQSQAQWRTKKALHAQTKEQKEAKLNAEKNTLTQKRQQLEKEYEQKKSLEQAYTQFEYEKTQLQSQQRALAEGLLKLSSQLLGLNEQQQELKKLRTTLENEKQELEKKAKKSRNADMALQQERQQLEKRETDLVKRESQVQKDIVNIKKREEALKSQETELATKLKAVSQQEQYAQLSLDYEATQKILKEVEKERKINLGLKAEIDLLKGKLQAMETNYEMKGQDIQKKEQGARDSQERILTQIQTIPGDVKRAAIREAVIQEAFAGHFLKALTAIAQIPAERSRTFISYAWGVKAHEKLVEQLARDIKAAGVGILLDKWNNQAGTFISRFTEEIDRCKYVLLAGSQRLMERYKAESGSINLEISQIFVKLTQKLGHVFPLLLDGDVSTALPPFLRDIVAIDFRDPTQYHSQVFYLLSVLLTRPLQQQMHALEMKIAIEPERSKDLQSKIDKLNQAMARCQEEIRAIEEDFDENKKAVLADEEWIVQQVEERIDIDQQIEQVRREKNRASSVNQGKQKTLEHLEKNSQTRSVNNNNSSRGPTAQPSPELASKQPGITPSYTHIHHSLGPASTAKNNSLNIPTPIKPTKLTPSASKTSVAEITQLFSSSPQGPTARSAPPFKLSQQPANLSLSGEQRQSQRQTAALLKKPEAPSLTLRPSGRI